MTPYYAHGGIEIYHGDCREVLASLDVASVDAVVTDPPYELGFMGKAWDASGVAFQVATWTAVLRALKPGGHLLAFGGTRTYHRTTCAIEDAGFEVRDCLQWIFGSGFPKSLDVSKAIDKAAGATRGVVGRSRTCIGPSMAVSRTSQVDTEGNNWQTANHITAPATDAAQRWQGWGTALKPAYEPIVLARKPLVGTVAANVQQYGTGAINVDACRIETESPRILIDARARTTPSQFGAMGGSMSAGTTSLGRWPANVLHDGSEEVLALFPQQAGASGPVLGSEPSNPAKNTYGEYGRVPGAFHADSGTAARFFYCAKASRSERGDGNTHPTVKPLALMRYLVRLITPPGGLVLDPFTGSGTTAIAARREGMRFLGVESHEAYCEIAARRIRQQETLPLEASA